MRLPRTLAAALGLLALAACTSPNPAGPLSPTGPDPSATGSPTAQPSEQPSATSSADPTPSPTPDPLTGMSLEEIVGQVIMTGAPVDAGGVAEVTRTAIVDHHVGNLFLHGRSEAGVQATAELVEQYTTLPDGDAPVMLVATDQEGYNVQVLRGPGFSDIPSAMEQATWPATDLTAAATTWGTELAQAGITLNLAPVMDLVPAENQQANAPIGYYSRNYGNTAQSVIDGAGAFARGMQQAGVQPVIKHFPGLGHVTQNTDTARDVVDEVVTADSQDIAVFEAGIEAGARYVMLANATYALIDPDNPATFSPEMVRILREDLAFDGVIMTDDVSAAAAVTDVAPGDRAVRAIEAGVDLVLASADPSVVPAMTEALVQRAEEDPAFEERVREAARAVLTEKANDPQRR
ncbi:glycoside hydrolase family 3 N-terminal domain-containing protein [Serinibacter salmoneus]|nr:glycoside hydrolase family 3 N-terminal domain-containing protein [Serinibacter salmoneus]